MEVIKWMSIADRHTKIFLDKHLDEMGLNSSQYMYILRVCRQPGITQDCFIRLFYIHPSNVTRAIAALEKEGFLERRSNQGDKRTCRLFPTQKALLVNETIQALCAQWQERLLAGFDEPQKEQFLQMLEQAAKNAVDGVMQDRENME